MDHVQEWTGMSLERVVSLMAYGMLSTALPTVLTLGLGVTAPYGRYATETRLGIFGFDVPPRFAWVVQECPSVLVPLSLALAGLAPEQVGEPRTVLLSMFLTHYVHRTLIFPFRITGGKPTKFLAFAMAFAFCAYNGLMQGLNLLFVQRYPASWLSDARFLTGAAVFALGMAINIHSDSILLNLRKPGEKGYKIPRGGLFELVSGANFLGEIVEWTGFAIATWSLPGLAFAVFTAFNIGPRAIHHHRWYKTKFEDYPKNRRALIPFLL